ncbi:MAG: group 1 truncated hemoglobin [Rhodospirillaceae bacterium]|jgi:hemoglobin|nr:group 1 truncated hemoglobin [Rhodospirillaceae bacterium]MBT3925365.1 group 1 truncated hemoglobin [Rhodospirillaceae bacterium]MBT4427632.1 group 1 truncated hemoglobin [Rhodospirillaceae bacterium]MBT5037858.1 group 1 truncated hemoglobin [Rhodospirillaceae bacterium]MBT5675343.1 group 1 truncated hemoglobin [Rhodospirillaceae bacterium]
MTFLDEVGGVPCLERVHKILYDKLISDPWLKQFFEGFKRWHLEVQQTEFMADLFGRKPALYQGRMPMYGHQHMFIDEEIFMIRHTLLGEAISEARVSDGLKERWLDYDMGMKKALVKSSVDECEGRFKTEEVIVIPKPR